MPSRKRKHDETDDEGEGEDLHMSPEAPSVNPYKVLEVEKDATADLIKSAYRRKALKHHPDKVAEEDKSTAHVKFQEIALAYAVLSDERRRKRYDITGRTDESLIVSGEDGDFNWTDFYRTQYEDAISEEKIEEFSREYKGSEEERVHVLAAYEKVKGKMAKLFQYVMLSEPEDEERFRAIIDEAIQQQEITAYKAYTDESLSQQARRRKAARASAAAEAAEAEEHAKVLPTLEVSSKKKKKIKKNGNDDIGDLAAMIRQRQNGRAAQAHSFFDGLTAKYGVSSVDEPPEEAFIKNRKTKKKS